MKQYFIRYDPNNKSSYDTACKKAEEMGYKNGINSTTRWYNYSLMKLDCYGKYWLSPSTTPKEDGYEEIKLQQSLFKDGDVVKFKHGKTNYTIGDFTHTHFKLISHTDGRGFTHPLSKMKDLVLVKAITEPVGKFKVGDKVRILKDTWSHRLTIGKVYTLNSDGLNLTGDIRIEGMAISPNDVELVIEETPMCYYIAFKNEEEFELAKSIAVDKGFTFSVTPYPYREGFLILKGESNTFHILLNYNEPELIKYFNNKSLPYERLYLYGDTDIKPLENQYIKVNSQEELNQAIKIAESLGYEGISNEQKKYKYLFCNYNFLRLDKDGKYYTCYSKTQGYPQDDKEIKLPTLSINNKPMSKLQSIITADYFADKKNIKAMTNAVKDITSAKQTLDTLSKVVTEYSRVVSDSQEKLNYNIEEGNSEHINHSIAQVNQISEILKEELSKVVTVFLEDNTEVTKKETFKINKVKV